MPWKLKVTEEGAAVLNDNGLPVFTDDDGTDTAFDPNQMHNKILDLNSESKKRREENKTLKDQLAAFEGIDDLAQYREAADTALKTVQNLKDKDLVKAGEIDKLKSEMRSGFEEKEAKMKQQFAERETELLQTVASKDTTIRSLLVSTKFAQSELFSGENPKTTLPPDIAETYFGKHFQVEEEGSATRIIAKDHNGEVILSRKNIGEPAEFDEAIGIIFDRYPGRDKLLRATSGGSGGAGGKGSLTKATPLAKLKAAYDQAVKDGDFTKQIALKNKIHEVTQAQQK